ncbi:PAS domain S-box protein, partial [bacterium]
MAKTPNEVRQRRRAEKVIEGIPGQEAPLRELVENVPVMMGVVELFEDDSDIRHIYDSPATDRFFGVEPGSTRGKTARELGVPDVTLAEWIARYREAESAGGPVRFEYPHVTERGQFWLSTVVVPLAFDGSGGARFSYVTAEVTERRRSIDALRESEARFRDLADNMDQLAWITDAGGSVLWFNRRWFEYTGTTPEAMLGWGWRSVHDPEALP